MKLVKGYLHYPQEPELYNCYLFTANRIVKRNGELVMGGGNALAFKTAYPASPLYFGNLISRKPNSVFELMAFPHKKALFGFFVTKQHYKDPSSLELVAEATQELKQCALLNPEWTYHLPYPAIGLGGLKKDDVYQLIKVLPDNVIVYE